MMRLRSSCVPFGRPLAIEGIAVLLRLEWVRLLLPLLRLLETRLLLLLGLLVIVPVGLHSGLILFSGGDSD